MRLSAHNLYRTAMYINFDVQAKTLFHYLKKMLRKNDLNGAR
jgi:hypothetical protein